MSGVSSENNRIIKRCSTSFRGCGDHIRSFRAKQIAYLYRKRYEELTYKNMEPLLKLENIKISSGITYVLKQFGNEYRVHNFSFDTSSAPSGMCRYQADHCYYCVSNGAKIPLEIPTNCTYDYTFGLRTIYIIQRACFFSEILSTLLSIFCTHFPK